MNAHAERESVSRVLRFTAQDRPVTTQGDAPQVAATVDEAEFFNAALRAIKLHPLQPRRRSWFAVVTRRGRKNGGRHPVVPRTSGATDA